ncbi:Protein of unknown function [Gryllus bimaculatus]|nr:Protein of unknown function [Gryllus bimaculatus]
MVLMDNAGFQPDAEAAFGACRTGRGWRCPTTGARPTADRRSLRTPGAKQQQQAAGSSKQQRVFPLAVS